MPARFKWVSGLVILLVLMGTFATGEKASAAVWPGPVGAGSCNETGGMPDEAYCTWSGFGGIGTPPLIGADSCTEVGSCLSLGDGVVIGDRSCGGSYACDSLGDAGSTPSHVGSDSCNGDEACYFAGKGGHADIGNESCNDVYACDGAGGYGSVTIGNGSCNGYNACYLTGSNFAPQDAAPIQPLVTLDVGGTSSIGDGSCNWEYACFFNGVDCFGAAGNISRLVCLRGNDGGGQIQAIDPNSPGHIGNFSCNHDDGIFDIFCTGIHAPVGDCQFNDPDKIPAPCNPDLTLSKVCVGDGFDASFVFLVNGPDSGGSAVQCGGDLVLPDLAPGDYSLEEVISGPDADAFTTMIICSDGSVVPGTTASLTLEIGADETCVVVNAFNADVTGLVCDSTCSAGGLEVDIANTNDNAVGVDNANQNTNANNNANDNSNNNQNANTNTNAQDQSSGQDQSNDNSQTNNITSSPEVNIDFGQ